MSVRFPYSLRSNGRKGAAECPVSRRTFSRLALGAPLALSAPFAVSGCASAPLPPLEARPPIARVVLKRDYDARPIIPVMVNGAGPFDFILDTASTRTAIFQNLATRLAIAPEPGRRTRVFSFAAVRRRPVVRLESLTIGGVAMPVGEALVFDDWDAPAQTPHGILGLDVLQNFLVSIDYPRRTFGMYAPGSRPAGFGPAVDATRLTRNGFDIARIGLYVAEALSQGREFPMLIDTGAALSLGNRHLIDGGRASEGAQLRVGGFATRILDANAAEATSYLLRIDNVRAGQIRWRRMMFFVSDAQIFRELGIGEAPFAILGFDQMVNRAFWIDFARAILYAPQLSPAGEP